jgi:hypothetical protein
MDESIATSVPLANHCDASNDISNSANLEVIDRQLLPIASGKYCHDWQAVRLPTKRQAS